MSIPESRHHFPSTRRLLNSSEFDAVFKNNQFRIGSAEFLILATPTRNTTSRIGMVIGKKTTALAVNRNTIKRLIRESFRTKFSNGECLDIVIISRKGVNQRSKLEIAEILQNIWLKLTQKMMSKEPPGSVGKNDG